MDMDTLIPRQHLATLTLTLAHGDGDTDAET